MRSCSEKREEKDLLGAKDLRSVGDPREGGGSRGERWERPAGPGRALEAPGSLGLCPEAERRWRGSEQLFLSKSLRPDVENMGGFKERMKNSQ